MTLAMEVNAVLVVLNTMLLGVLLVFYARMSRRVPTTFTWGLTAFALVLFVQQAVQLYFFATMMSLYAGPVEGIVLAQNALTALAVGFLTYVTVRPSAAPKTDDAPQPDAG